MQPHKSLKYEKQRSSGTLMGMCRHGFIEPGGAVDTQVGERCVHLSVVVQLFINLSEGSY